MRSSIAQVCHGNSTSNLKVTRNRSASIGGCLQLESVKSFALRACALLICIFSVCGMSLGQEVDLSKKAFEQNVVPFFQQHCLRCHGSEEQKAERRFDLLSYPIKDDDALVDFQDALDLINLAEMPPEDEPQPTDEQQQAVVEWLTAAIAHHQESRESTGGETVLRRLNRREYLNTISDLFELNIDHFDPTVHFPADQELHHLDNQGHELVTSGFLLQQHLKAAQEVVEKALPPLEKPKVQEWYFDGGFEQKEYLGATLYRVQLDERVEQYRKELEKDAKQLSEKELKNALWQFRTSIKDAYPDHIRLHEHPRAERHIGSYGFVSDFAQGVPHDGYYEVTLQAVALYRESPYEENFAQTRSEEPLTMTIVPGDSREGSLHLPQVREPELARFELEDDVVKEYRARVWLDRGVTPRFSYVNGTHRARPGMIKAGFVELEKDGIEETNPQNAFGYGIIHGKFPQIRIHSVSIKGPFYECWPTPFQHQLLSGLDFSENEASRHKAYRPKLENYLRRAWRRPVGNADVDAILAVIRSREATGTEPRQAYCDGVAAALCMPSFLYLVESKTDGADGQLNQHAIASRLSYFLWSSMPDQTLMDLADKGKLSEPAELSRQVERMLADHKSDRFVRDFLGAWLNLDALGSTPPDINSFKEYYIDNLEWAMKEETFHYARHILDEGLSIELFLDSDFSFVNSGLARFYGLDKSPPDREFQKFSFPGKSPRQRRGGLLGQPSVLTVTANGVDTSPIVRGVWILENILGTPPNPPPPDVEPLDPDIRGAKTIRDQLEKHRADATCAECHRKIDPLGFALENFDAIGRWRTKYRPRGNKLIDASGTLPGGKQFKSFVDFKRIMLSQKEKLARALTEKMLAYALGRPVEISDRPEVDAIIADLKGNDWKFRFLVKRVVLSSAFQRP